MLKKLPSLTRIKCYEDFYCKLFKVKTLEGTSINVTKVHLTKANEKTLANHIKKKMRKKHKDMRKKYWDSSFSMYWLQYSPSTADKVNPKNGYAWVEE